jgi:hypothetical protein
MSLSSPRYGWWTYVKDIIRRYPALKALHADLHTSSVISNYAGVRASPQASRTTESVAIRELPNTSQREYEAVRRAIDATERYSNGRDRLKVIRLVLWDRTHTLEGAALMVPCSYRTARRWHTEFICMVASYYGLMD